MEFNKITYYFKKKLLNFQLCSLPSLPSSSSFALPHFSGGRDWRETKARGFSMNILVNYHANSVCVLIMQVVGGA
jgi:hypothetical protein